MPVRHLSRTNVAKQLLLRANKSPESLFITRTTTLLSQPRPVTLPQPFNAYRNFSQSPLLLKKKTKADRENAEEKAETGKQGAADDPFDFTALEAGIDKALDKLKNDLKKLRTGGRFNPEVLENLRVPLQKDSKKLERLGDLAQVLPKGGRSLMVLVGEKDHVHAVMSAIQGSSDLNLQPMLDAKNPNQLNVPIPPPTKESRDQALAAASKTGETAKTAIQAARGVQQKRLRAMELNKTARPDDLRKAHKDMEKVMERGATEVKKYVEEARKAMMQT
ncbi:Uncharacterized protein BP5553_08548 [Venustampulla echinocandica]|uniref:Ribosome recycling factor domain-containing protein n=1 Tax=Venustampulla echinocandica TaxID=2656787 RepID=A0A370TEJ7_9HELO|nr:Uncharacterized protein BP5553_08548 [Venustampulla echinocandica]RDL33109.1 Uncharacterized protein BP5553_08548 [Venustampulla echinocandica]